VSRRPGGGGILAIVLIVLAVVAVFRRANQSDAPDDDSRSPSAIDTALTPAQAAAERDGLAAAILIDVSGSMEQPAGKGSGVAKIVSARRAAQDLVEQFARYADDHKGEPVLLGIYEFSTRSGQPDCREVMPMGPPDRARASAAIAQMQPKGGTPIGAAMVTGKLALDATGLSRRHMLVVTDGENTDGFTPEQVSAAIARRPSMEQPSIYFVAFDIAASRFDAVRNSGGLVLEAADARALNETLDTLLRGKILIEKN
jgi:Ca-activated chloride channel family protein